MKTLLYILTTNTLFANPTAWQDDPSGGSSMPIWLMIIGFALLYFMFKGK